MEKKTSIWNLNFAFLLSIFLHIYLIFFLTKSDFNFLDKKERVTITLSAIGTMEEAPKESIEKEKIKIKKKPEIKKIKKNLKKKSKRKLILKKLYHRKNQLNKKK